jgi:hypothetical protein
VKNFNDKNLICKFIQLKILFSFAGFYDQLRLNFIDEFLSLFIKNISPLIDVAIWTGCFSLRIFEDIFTQFINFL